MASRESLGRYYPGSMRVLQYVVGDAARPGSWLESRHTRNDEERSVDQEGDLRRLRWRSRRGMRELDQLFNRWLDQRYAQASEAERGVFLQLLDCEDDRLWKWFLGHERPADVELDALVQSIRALPHTS